MRHLAPSRQDRVDVVFSSLVHLIGATRVVTAMGAVSASLLTATAIAVLASAPRWIDHVAMSGPGQRLERFVRDSSASVVAPVGVPAQVSAEEEAFPERQLNKEQTNLVKFITRKYSIDWNAAQEYVFQAFHAARDARVDPLLVLAVMSIESSFDSEAQSHAGAQGLMQVLTRVHKEKFEPFGGPQSAFDPVANIRVGTQILKHYLGVAGGSFEAALKYYVGAALMTDDQGYGFKVLNERLRLVAASQGKPIPNLPNKRPEPVSVLPTSTDSGSTPSPVLIDKSAVEAATVSVNGETNLASPSASAAEH